MSTLSFPKPSNTVYPRLRFAEMANLQRQTEFNRKAFMDFVADQPFNMENEHTLVGLLQQLSINAEWELPYVVQYTRFRAYSLCTMYKITSLGRIGEAVTSGFYREGVREHWCLIENTKTYDSKTTLEELRAVVPLCSSVTKHSYKHNLEREDRTGAINDLAIIGVDLVELAVGWWLYQRLNRTRDTGIHAYVAQYPLMTAQLVHNQLAVLNVLYDHVLHNQPLSALITTDDVVFTTTNEQKLLTHYLEFLVNFFGNRRLQSFEHFLTQVESIYKEEYFNYVPAGKNGLFAQTSWVWEPAIMKLYSIYLAFANRGNYQASDINTLVDRTHIKRINSYQRIPETYFRGWFIQLADEMQQLTLENLKL